MRRLTQGDQIGERSARDPVGHAAFPEQGLGADFTLSRHPPQVFVGDRAMMRSSPGIKPRRAGIIAGGEGLVGLLSRLTG